MCHKLKQIREDQGWTVAELVELSELSSCTIYRIESGDTTFKVNIGTAEALAYALDVNVEDIFAMSELSYIGRPPHTGKSLVRETKHQSPGICPDHFIELSMTGECDMCGSVPVTVPRLALVG